VFRVIIAVALIVAGVLLSQQAESSGLPISSSLIIPLWVVFVLLGWLIFQYTVWSGSWHAFTSPQTIVLKTEKTPFQLFMNVVGSCITNLVGGAVLIAIALGTTGHGDLLAQILQVLLQKLIRVIEAILS
jgi:hypothetical protein